MKSLETCHYSQGENPLRECYKCSAIDSNKALY